MNTPFYPVWFCRQWNRVWIQAGGQLIYNDDNNDDDDDDDNDIPK